MLFAPPGLMFSTPLVSTVNPVPLLMVLLMRLMAVPRVPEGYAPARFTDPWALMPVRSKFPLTRLTVALVAACTEPARLPPPYRLIVPDCATTLPVLLLVKLTPMMVVLLLCCLRNVPALMKYSYP